MCFPQLSNVYNFMWKCVNVDLCAKPRQCVKIITCYYFEFLFLEKYVDNIL